MACSSYNLSKTNVDHASVFSGSFKAMIQETRLSLFAHRLAIEMRIKTGVPLPPTLTSKLLTAVRSRHEWAGKQKSTLLASLPQPDTSQGQEEGQSENTQPRDARYGAALFHASISPILRDSIWNGRHTVDMSARLTTSSDIALAGHYSKKKNSWAEESRQAR